MADDLAAPATVPATAEEWLRVLSKALQDRRNGREGSKIWARHLSAPTRIRPGLELMHDYLEGDPPLLNYAAGWDELFRVIARLGRLNIAELIINAKSSKMKLNGFRTAATDDDLGDKQAAAIMRANNLKVKAREVHDYMLWASDGYAMVTPPTTDGVIPVITSEDPRETITAHDPATGQTRAALKLFRDEWDKADIAHLYVRDGDTVTHYPLIKRGRTTITSGVFRTTRGWELMDVPAELDRMPIIRFRNRGGRGEYERHLDTLDRINDQIMSKVVIAKVQAFRQMAIENLPDTVTHIGDDGEPEEVEIDYTDAFEATPGSLWRLPEGAKIWESTPTDLGPLRLSIKDDLENLAAVTQTALPAITPDAASGSAEGAALMREEHVGAVEACLDYAGGSWAEVMSTAFAFMGDTSRADLSQLEAIWGPVERFSLSEKADAASKAITSLPREAIQSDIWQYPPAEVIRLRQMSGADLLSQQAPPGAAPGAVPQVTFVPPRSPGDTGATA